MASDLSASWQSSSTDAQTALHRHQAHLEARLQDLLDAQSEGLLAGLTGAVAADERSSTSSTGTITPTSVTAPTSGSVLTLRPRHDEDGVDRRRKGAQSQAIVTPVNQPKQRPVSLHRARRGIARTIAELAALKTSEVAILSSEADKRSAVLSRIHGFTAKEAGLHARIERIEADAPNAQLAEMKREEGELALEIHSLETRLYEMKAQHRVLRQRVEEAENGVQAKLSSYQSSLELARREVAAFLARPPPGLEHVAAAAGGVTQTGKEGAAATRGRKKGPWALPPDRRTLEMVQEHYEAEEGHLQDQIGVAETERDALEKGAEAWGHVLGEIQGVEDALKSEMAQLATTPTAPANNSHNNPDAREAGMRRILTRMTAARAEIEQKFNLAEQQGWKLLVCCIGAELEALSEGYRVLEAASSQAASSTAVRHDQVDGEGETGGFEQDLSSPPLTPPLTTTMRGHERRIPRGKEYNNNNSHGRLVDVYEDDPSPLPAPEEEGDDDEGPSADLLVSQHEDL